MSDERLRRLERDVVAGDTIGRSRLISERVRAGHLTPERVRLAAYAGDAAARELLGKDAPSPAKRTKAFALGLGEFGKQAGVCAAIAAANVLAPLLIDPPMRKLDDVIAAARAWLECPCEAHRHAASDVAKATDWLTRQAIWATAIHNAAIAASRLDRTDGERARAAGLAARDAAAAAWNALWIQREPRLMPAGTRASVAHVDEAFVRDAIERALRAFALA